MGRQCIEIDRETHTLEEVQRVMNCTPRKEGFLRLHAITFLLRGYSRSEVEELLLIPSRTLRDWVKKYNERGVDGVITRARPGRPKLLDQLRLIEEAREFFTEGGASVVKFHGHLLELFKKKLHYTTVWRAVHNAGYRLKVPRKKYPDSDEELKKDFINKLTEVVSDPAATVFFCDEVGFEGDPRPCKHWFMKGVNCG